MPDPLPRRKPDPIPPIRPVPEYAADPALTAIYEDTKRALQTPWMGVVTMAFAHYRAFYGALWSGLRPLAESRPFVDACASLRAVAEAQAENLAPTPLSDRLRAAGYADPELDEIRALVEIFSHGNMPYLLIATAARLLLEGEALSPVAEAPAFEGRHGPAADGRLVLIEPHHADAPTQALYADIRATLGLPFVNTDYRAFARWPTAFAPAWSDLRHHVPTPEYDAALTRVHDHAVGLIRALPNPGGLTPDALRAAAETDADLAEIASVVRLFQWLLPGLVVNVAHIRAQLER